MPELSVGTNIAWQIAAHEAASARFQFIEDAYEISDIINIRDYFGWRLEEGMSDFFKGDKEIRQFQKEYPEIYAGLMKIIEGDYGDEAVR